MLFCVFGERAVGESPRGGEASWYCVDLADAFRLLLSRKKNYKSFVWGDCVPFPKNGGVRWAQVSESRDGVAAESRERFHAEFPMFLNASREKILENGSSWQTNRCVGKEMFQ